MTHHPGVRTLYSTFAADDLAWLVQREYDLPGSVTCRLIRRGFNDNYLVEAAGVRYILRVYLHNKAWIRSEGDVRFELDLLGHLTAEGVPVSHPVRRRNGDSLGVLEAPEGQRYYALFTYAPGVHVRDMEPRHNEALGQAVARLHLSADRFTTPHTRYSLDLVILIDLPMQRMQPYLRLLAPEDAQFLTDMAARVRQRIGALTLPPGSWGIIHADVHGGNNHFTDDGAVTLFDFDHGGYGWRAYDLAPMMMKDLPARDAFLRGYQSVRPLSEEEMAAMPDFIKARAIWDDGDAMAMIPIWGDDWVPGCLRRLIPNLRKLEEQYPS